MVAGKKRIVLGVGGYLGHDANAALFVGDELIAASQEERFSRRKHDGHFPLAAIRNCLEIGGIEAGEVDVCVFAEKPFQTALFERTGITGNVAVYRNPHEKSREEKLAWLKQFAGSA